MMKFYLLRYVKSVVGRFLLKKSLVERAKAH